MKKIGLIFLGFIFVLLMVSFVFAADVGYLLKKAKRADKNVMDVFEELGLTVDLIEDKMIKDVDFSDYKLLYIGDKRLRNIKHVPVYGKMVLANKFYGKMFGFLDRGRLTKVASNAKLKIQENGDVISVYQRARFKIGGIGIPYYYLPNKYKNSEVISVGKAFKRRGREVGDVIAHLDDKCFFGIIKSKFWTEEARELFKECVAFVLGDVEEEPECVADEDCSEDILSDPYCSENNVVKDLNDFSCVEGLCVEEVSQDLVEECLDGCLDGECVVEEGEENDENHDIKLVDDYDGFGHKIRLRDFDNEILEDDKPVFECDKKYDLQFKTTNVGDFNESIKINLTIFNLDGIVFENFKETDLAIGKDTTSGNKNNLLIDFEAGDYTVKVVSSIVGFDDDNPDDNTASREIEVSCDS